MITIIQRVTQASVSVENKIIGDIRRGIMALVAVEKNDTHSNVERLFERIIHYRIFSDKNDKMNLSLRDIEGGLLLVPQFTLAANTNKGNRPSFASAAPPEFGREMFAYLQDHALKNYHSVQFGQFGADMQVALINNGPVTFTLTVSGG